MKGLHLIAHISNMLNVDIIKTVDVKQLLEKIIDEMKINVNGEISHQFQPFGATLLYLLAESHMSIHFYVEEKYVAIDLYCCNEFIDMNKDVEIIYDYFNGDCIPKKKKIDINQMIINYNCHYFFN